MSGLVALATWFCLWGVIGALIAPRKGLSPLAGFVTAGLFAIFGVAFLALLRDEADQRPPADRPDWMLPTRTKVYLPGQEAFLVSDQRDAAAHGWHPVARDFGPDGSMRVTYRQSGPSGWSA